MIVHQIQVVYIYKAFMDTVRTIPFDWNAPEFAVPSHR